MRTIFKSVGVRLFSAPHRERTAWDVILWWETRRLAYNALMAALGMGGLLAFMAPTLRHAPGAALDPAWKSLQGEQ